MADGDRLTLRRIRGARASASLKRKDDGRNREPDDRHPRRARLYYGTDDRFTRDVRSIEDAPEYLRPQYQKHWSYVHTVEWWTRHWEKTGLVEVRWAELLSESSDLLRDYATDRPPEQDEDSIMQAVPQDRDGLIALFCLVACKR